MENKVLLCNLYDYYFVLLTDQQQLFFKYYYFDDLSLSEIGFSFGVSRNAVYSCLKGVVTKLKDFELKLKLYEKSIAIKKIIKDIDDNVKKEINNLI
ncbi:MAG: sigma factor-like helix-turn-helix DNA-binding protein [Bacilli bacterium]